MNGDMQWASRKPGNTLAWLTIACGVTSPLLVVIADLWFQHRFNLRRYGNRLNSRLALPWAGALLGRLC